MILKQKTSDKLFTHNIKINTSITAEITKIKNEINTKIGDELSIRDTKISNEVTTRLSEINASFIAKLGKINTELNNKLIAEIENFKARDAGYVTEAQKIFARLFNIEKAHRNDFDRIISLEKSVIASIDDLYKKINQYYAKI